MCFALQFLLGFVYFPPIPGDVACKMYFLKYKCKHVSSKGICVKVCLFLLFQTLIWRLEKVVSDRQQSHPDSSTK
jgi:hypothetical protein